MKLVIVAALIGAGQAFAPAQAGKASIRRRASAVTATRPPLAMTAAQLPLGVFRQVAVFDAEATSFKFQEKPAMALTADAIIGDLGSAVDRAFSPAYILAMKVVSSIGAAQKRSKTCQVVRRRGRLYVIDKKHPRNKCRQGGAKMKRWQKGK